MKYTFVFAGLATSVLAATVPIDNWSTLTPTASAPSGAVTDYPLTFGIQVSTISKNKRDVVNQITDGQIQKQSGTLTTKTATAIQQIGDGQIQHQTTAPAIQQIGDGQIQHQTTAPAIQQIGDGQIQHQTTAPAIQQIGDGQIQHQTTAPAIQQIGDGQIQHQTTTATGAQQISDGQVQQPTTLTTKVKPNASQVSDGQVQASGSFSDNFAIGCLTENTLAMTLKNGELRDSKNRVGAIVANRQFQFDGPPPQAGTIYAGGWSITPDGFLAIGDSKTFYQCLSGDFYNLYDKLIGAQCVPVYLTIIDLVPC
ncbi:uncharacterized protein KQ657_000855 [Scheffersomyces spartinae]|uniref:Cell wall mannoprotein PIR1-like C-terminal domain-containing protein n=1 Tax=Scheffersomyces spartinae TaxID=45513 RepID=A0A9P8AHJ9_9ASCO|nr:uncharacterized protein KQ657_000855 [Scheffersomyces spartinae]KAG7193437.1 hypothetical protein KQ657_000855 [Scheffersomyces spartinae]